MTVRARMSVRTQTASCPKSFRRLMSHFWTSVWIFCRRHWHYPMCTAGWLPFRHLNSLCTYNGISLNVKKNTTYVFRFPAHISDPIYIKKKENMYMHVYHMYEL